MKRRVLLGCLILGLPVSLWTAGCATTSPPAGSPKPVVVSLDGAVTDYRGRPAGPMTVELLDDEEQVVTRVRADESGRFLVQALPLAPGRYAVRLAPDDFRESRHPLVVSPAESGQTLELRLALPPQVRGGPGDQNYATVRVFYATDRRATGTGDPRAFYGGDRGDGRRLAYGVVEVSIPREHRLGALETPSIWRLEFREDPATHVVLLSVTPREPDEFYRALAGRVAQSRQREAFVFVHGYNVTFRDAARRTAQLAYDLAFDGAPVLYSWPSRGVVTGYPADESSVEWTTSHLKSFLEEFAARSGATTIHLIAHSMGNRALANALQRIAIERRGAPAPWFRQVVLTAPDIDAGVFEQIARAVTTTAERVTLYASSRDDALVASRRFHRYPRAGESGGRVVVISGMDTVDVTDVDTSLLGHSYYGDNRSVLSDLFRLLREGVPPARRFGLVSVQHPNGTYWAFRP